MHLLLRRAGGTEHALLALLAVNNLRRAHISCTLHRSFAPRGGGGQGSPPSHATSLVGRERKSVRASEYFFPWLCTLLLAAEKELVSLHSVRARARREAFCYCAGGGVRSPPKKSRA